MEAPLRCTDELNLGSPIAVASEVLGSEYISYR